jgi:hypothetical protein
MNRLRIANVYLTKQSKREYKLEKTLSQRRSIQIQNFARYFVRS